MSTVTITDRQTNRRTGEQAAKPSYRDAVPKTKGFSASTFGDKKILLLPLANFWVGQPDYRIHP